MKMHLMPTDVLDAPQPQQPQIRSIDTSSPSLRYERKWKSSPILHRRNYKIDGTPEHALLKLTNDCWDNQYIDNPYAYSRTKQASGKKVVMRSPDNVGMLMGMLERLLPTSQEEWEHLYLAERHLDVYRTAKALREHMASPKYGEVKLTYQQAIDIVLVHVIDETWIGWSIEQLYISTRQMELDAEALLGGLPYLVRKATPNEERAWAADIIVEDFDGIVDLIQIKPMRYFTSLTAGLAKDTLTNQRRNAKALRETGVPVAYVAYKYDARLGDNQALLDIIFDEQGGLKKVDHLTGKEL